MEEEVETQMESPDTTATIAIDGFGNIITENTELRGDPEKVKVGLLATSTQTTATSDDTTIKKSNRRVRNSRRGFSRLLRDFPVAKFENFNYF